MKMMNAYMITSSKIIEPFNEHPRQSLIVNQELGNLQEGTLQSCGLELKPIANITEIDESTEHIIFVDSLYFTKELLNEFIARSRVQNRRTTCAAKVGITTLRSVVNTQDVMIYPDHIEYGLSYVPAKAPKDDPVPVVIDLDQFFEDFPMPEHMFGSKNYPIPMTDLLIAQIDHWTNLWAMNIGTLLSEAAKLKKASKLKLLRLALKAASFNQWRVVSKLNRIGCNCDIHPTAYIEGSAIGNNVRVGARSVIRESIIGDKSYIGNNVTIDLSVTGEECNIRNGAVVQYAVLYPGTFTMNRLISISLCGRDTFLGDGVVLSDFRLNREPVTVIRDGRQINTGNTFIGSCLGHGVYLGAGIVLAPGRTIPNGTRIALDEARIIRKCYPQEEIPGHRRVKVF
jgi:UDP-N-acetylglucosamine diphosphorylase / glucose-1-phosphate thymidylyltransferase / UDP-N-acetylgalactosamine diphosphorylase / glucosamine-1-phosphate N-acetyltransferase / galactosamine-1-phosphate N-acetyltransferase